MTTQQQKCTECEQIYLHSTVHGFCPVCVTKLGKAACMLKSAFSESTLGEIFEGFKP